MKMVVSFKNHLYIQEIYKTTALDYMENVGVHIVFRYLEYHRGRIYSKSYRYSGIQKYDFESYIRVSTVFDVIYTPIVYSAFHPSKPLVTSTTSQRWCRRERFGWVPAVI